jgi:3'(2'), 5'-bisphosphate nucleotidase
MDDPTSLLTQVAALARSAGTAILEVYQRHDHDVTFKDDRSPLTAADLASHRALQAGLGKLSPELPFLSEEGAGLPYAVRRHWTRFWLVDPLDGTKEFIHRNGEFTVNIALVENGEPVLGVVHAPVLDRTYLAAQGSGAFCQDGVGEWRPIRATGTTEPELRVVASRSHAGPEVTALLAHLPPHRLVSMGSALKLCLVAAAQADFYPRLGPTMEWDTAAAHAVVAAAGGQVLDTTSAPLRYNKEDLRNPHFLVLGQRFVPWQAALAATQP